MVPNHQSSLTILAYRALCTAWSNGEGCGSIQMGCDNTKLYTIIMANAIAIAATFVKPSVWFLHLGPRLGQAANGVDQVNIGESKNASGRSAQRCCIEIHETNVTTQSLVSL